MNGLPTNLKKILKIESSSHQKKSKNYQAIKAQKETESEEHDTKTILEFQNERWINVLLDIQKLEELALNDYLKQLTLKTLKQIKDAHKISYYSLMKVLEFYGAPEILIEEYEEEERRNMERKQKEEDAKAQKEAKDGFGKFERRSYSLVKDSNGMQIVPYGSNLSITQKVKKDIERIKKGKEEREAKVSF
jgi:hypothetical protein